MCFRKFGIAASCTVANVSNLCYEHHRYDTGSQRSQPAQRIRHVHVFAGDGGLPGWVPGDGGYGGAHVHEWLAPGFPPMYYLDHD